jgi:Holliday junction resolvase
VQRELFADLERFGFSVCDTSALGDDFPDAVIGRQGITTLLEVKTPRGLVGTYRISEGQKLFAREWRGSPIITGHKAERVATEFIQLAKRFGQWPKDGSKRA